MRRASNFVQTDPRQFRSKKGELGVGAARSENWGELDSVVHGYGAELRIRHCAGIGAQAKCTSIVYGEDLRECGAAPESPDAKLSLPKVMADRVQLQQVFMNLMLNAIEAMQVDGGELTVKSKLADSQLVLSVSDTGVGLPPEMDEIFSAFFTTKSQGRGMGLAISRSIVESHVGQLWATPNHKRGASFYFTLPIEVRASSRPAS